MGPGAVFMRAAPFQLVRLIGFQIGKQVPFLCFCDLFFRNARYKITP